MNYDQQQKMVEIVNNMIDSTHIHSKSLIWILLWDIVDPTAFQTPEVVEYAKNMLRSLVGMVPALAMITLMEGASLNSQPLDDNNDF
jgi:hypothetical protein